MAAVKCKKSAGHDGLTAEHIKYGGTTICKWLTKILNRISTLEEIPASMKTGIIIPIYKKKGLNPLLPSSYRGITIPPVLAKLYELIILRRLQPILSELNLPEKLQTAYQKGLSCSDAITKNMLRRHTGSNPCSLKRRRTSLFMFI